MAQNITIAGASYSAVPSITVPKTGGGVAQFVDSEGITKYAFAITEDIVTVTTDPTKGVSPYSASYGYTNITIDADAGIEWVEGAIYSFIVNTEMVVASGYRNVRVRIGENGDWKPCMTSSTIASGNTYFIKTYNTTWQYKSVYQANGALHVQTDNNTIYTYLINQIVTGGLKIDSSGFGARYSLVFPTTPLCNNNGLVTDERWSSLVSSCSTGTSKTAVTPSGGKFYIDRHPQSQYSSANIAAGGVSASATYQDYSSIDLRYSCNTNLTYLTAAKRVFLWLKDFDPSDMSFKSDATIGNIMTIDKITTRFPSNTQGSVYLYFLGTTTTTYYNMYCNFTQIARIYKYTPSTGEMFPFIPKFGFSAVATSGSYNDLSDKPTIPAAQVQSNWNETDTSSKAYIQNKPTIPSSLSQMTEDTTHRVVTDTEKSTWNGKSTVSASASAVSGANTAQSVNINGTNWNLPSGGGGTTLYKHEIILGLTNGESQFTLISTVATRITNRSIYNTVAAGTIAMLSIYIWEESADIDYIPLRNHPVSISGSGIELINEPCQVIDWETEDSRITVVNEDPAGGNISSYADTVTQL